MRDAIVVILLCLAGASAALSARGKSRATWWQVAAGCCFALAVAAVVLAVYLHA
jgi:hypothetical protein